MFDRIVHLITGRTWNEAANTGAGPSSPGGVASDSLEFPGSSLYLLTRRLRWIVYGIWPTAILLQWVALPLLSLASGTFISLEAKVPCERMVPFAQDYYYFVWNLLPFALAASVRLAEKSLWQAVGLGIPDKHREQASLVVNGTIRRWDKVAFSWPVIVGAIALGSIGVYHQFVKVALWARTGACAYWWQAEYSSVVFYSRLAVLFVNMFCIVFAALALVSLLLAFARLSHARLWELDLLHVDGCGGAAQFGKTALAFTAVPFTMAVCALLGYFDHRSSGLLHGLGDSALLFAATGLGTMTFVLPLRPIHKAMLEAKTEACTLTQKAIRRLGAIIPRDGSDMADATSIQRMRDLKRDRDTLLEIYQMYAKAPTWPFNLAIFLRITATLAGPVAVFLADLIGLYVSR